MDTSNSVDIRKQLPRDVFLYLLSIVTLITAAVSFGVLCYQYVSVYFPDAINYYGNSANLDNVRWAIAVLVVMFPVFFFVSRFLRHDMNQVPEKRELKVRKWLLYLTLFIAALVIMGDLVTLLLNFLRGDLTIQFILKVIVILFIAGAIFIHYFSELKEKEKEFRWIGLFDKIIIVVVMAAVVAGFFVAGSPQNQRAIRFDDQRVSDLQNIQSQVINYWQTKGKLPTTLSDLKNDISGFSAPVDPENTNQYAYNVLGSMRFELCAVFNRDNSQTSPRAVTQPQAYPKYPGMNDTWQHGAGRVCFERQIDPDFYPPIKKGTPIPAPLPL